MSARARSAENTNFYKFNVPDPVRLEGPGKFVSGHQEL
jgi:hypothetical protein